MAPPKADLNNKEKNIDHESIPEAVFIDQKSECNKASIQRHQCKRRRKCKAGLICLAVVVVALIVALPILVLHMRRHRHSFGRFCGTTDNIRVPEHVRIDDKRKLIFVNGTKTGHYDAFNAVHDYNHKLSAFRHTKTKKCFIDSLHKSFDDGIKEWDRDDDDKEDRHHGDKHHDKHDDKHRGIPVRYFQALKPTEESVAHHFWGEHVANHCKDHKFHMLRPLKDAMPKVDSSSTIIIRIASVDAVRVIYVNIKFQ